MGPRPTSAANPPVDAAAVDRRDRLTDTRLSSRGHNSSAFRQPPSTCRTAFPAQHLRPSGVLGCWPDGLELTPGFSVLGVHLKRTCSRVTSASSALGVLDDYVLYKSTHSLITTYVLPIIEFISFKNRLYMIRCCAHLSRSAAKLWAVCVSVCSDTVPDLHSEPLQAQQEVSQTADGLRR